MGQMHFRRSRGLAEAPGALAGISAHEKAAGGIGTTRRLKRNSVVFIGTERRQA
jgi:hypothetical protein